ncbi:MAG: signal peptidase II, partial [Nanoarchaeota archaeon]
MARKNLLRGELALALLTAFALDRLTKWWALAVLRREGTIQVIPNIFHLTFTINSGAAFSILSGKNAFLIFLSLCVIFFIIYSYFRLPASRTTSIAVGL